MYVLILGRISPLNGHGGKTRYSTRNKTGRTKRKMYEDDTSYDEESEDEHIPKGKGKGKTSGGRRVSTRSSPRKAHNGHNYREKDDG